MLLESKFPKLLFVIDSLNSGGAQRQLVNLAVGLTDRGYSVEVFCYAPGDILAPPLYDKNITIHWLMKRSRFSMDVIFNLRRLFDVHDYELVLSFLSTPNFYSIVAGKLLGTQYLPILISERSSDYPGWVSRSELLVRRLYKFADHIIFNSNHQRVNLVTQFPAVRDRSSTIYNGYDLNLFVPPMQEPANHPLKILVVARVSPYKNGLCLIEALRILKEKYALTLTVDWIGQRIRTGDHLAYLQEMDHRLQEYGLETQWCWLDQRSDIVEQLHEHDVLVHPSFVEGLPNVVCEALACGRPVIVSNTLEHPILVQDGQSGYLFDWRDPSDLASKIRLFSTLSPEQRSSMGKKGREFAEARLSMKRYVDEFEHLFRRLLDRKTQ
jgi:glycosyltransferase involved in cell wall biosynthesis